jgi:5'-3' exonuclease
LPPTDPHEQEVLKIARKQFNEIRNTVLPYLGFNNNFIQTGLEADDLIASITINMATHPCEFIIVSTDKDLYQLLGTKVLMYSPRTKKTITSKQFKDKYGIPPSLWGNVKSIAGCDSDNVKGVKGVAELTAIKYLTATLPKHYKTCQAITTQEGQETINRNLPLVSLPHIDTKPMTLQKDNLTIDSYIETCTYFNFLSLLKTPTIKHWKEVMCNDT